MNLSVVIPTYRAENTLAELYESLTMHLKKIDIVYEIVFVEDCGGDRSWELICQLAAADPKVKGIQLARNYGEHYAITAGMDNARGDAVVVMACDMQDDPSGLPAMYRQLLAGHDLVYALRVGLKYKWTKILLSKIFYFVLNLLSDSPFDGRASNYVMLSPLAVKYFRQYRERLRTFRGILTRMGLKGASVEVPHQSRAEGESSYGFRKALKLALNHILAYSDKPFEYVLSAGLFVALFAFVYGSYLLARALIFGYSVPGWGTLVVSIFFLGGTIIFTLGFIGLYVKKSFEEVMARPIYYIRASANLNDLTK